MTDTLAPDVDPEQLRRQLVKLFAEPKNLHHIVAAGLDGVRRQLAELCEAIDAAENGADQVVATVAELANLVRQEQRKHGGAVAQARKEHERAELLAAEVERLRGELADCQLAASEAQGQAQRDETQILRAAVAKIYAYFGWAPVFGAYGEGGRKAAELIAPPRLIAEFGGSPVLCGDEIPSPLGNGVFVGPCIRPANHPGNEHEAASGARWARLEPAPCWCGHDPKAHITDDSDTAVCRACISTPTGLHRAFHTIPHSPEQP